ncbi:MAG: tetratricopeptide repeat protein [Deltaproteobacteria bacterium]|jgi:tetratricopeptide (TPR) repeat protein
MKIKTLGILLCFWLGTATAWGNDALHYYNLGEKSSIDSRKIDYFNKALQLNPNLVEAYEKRAILYYFQRRYERAIEDYTRVLALWPDNLEAYRIRGMAFLKKGEFDLAISDFDHALELDPKLVSAYSYRAEAYRLKGMKERAIRDASRAINLKGGDLRALANAYSTRAKTYQQLGKEDLAEADFKKSYELDPRFAILRYFYGTFRLEDVHRMGLVGIIGLLFVGIFRLSLPAPRKKGQDQ